MDWAENIAELVVHEDWQDDVTEPGTLSLDPEVAASGNDNVELT